MKKRPTYKRYASVLLIFIATFLAGCAASVTSVDRPVSASKKIVLSRVTGEASQFVDQFKEPFERAGFIFGESDDPNRSTLVVKLEPNPFHTKFDVRWEQSGVTLIHASAENNGWGTGINRAGALADLADKVSVNLQNSLATMTLTIKADQSITAVACSGLFNDPKLDPISGKVILDGDSPATFGMLVDKTTPMPSEVKAIFQWADIQQKCVEKKVKIALDTGDQQKADLLLANYNERQRVLAKLANGEITFGQFAAAANEVLNKAAEDRAARESKATADLEREKDRGQTSTAETQKRYQGAASVTKPTYTQCNRIGNQVFCNSF